LHNKAFPAIIVTMLNYIWAGLIIISVVFALWQDGSDLRHDRYRNGDALAVQIEGLPPGYEDMEDAETVGVSIRIDPATYLGFFDPIARLGYASDSPEADKVREQIETFFKDPLPGTLVTTPKGRELHITKPESLPAPLDTIYKLKKNDEEHLPARVTSWDTFEIIPPANEAETDNASDTGATATATAQISFGNIGFVKIRDITTAMFDKAKGAVMLAIGLMGAIALWMGMMKIAEDAGLINVFVKIVRPVLGPLFPQLPKDHPALGLIALNLAANMLGLGNAATPLGIKAMESLQELNPEKDTATDSMVMLLAMNTAGVQLIPPVTLLAILGVAAGDVFIPILMVTGISLIIAITTTKLLGRMKMFRKTDPMRNGPVTAQATDGGAA
jgi:spore maturation protein A